MKRKFKSGDRVRVKPNTLSIGTVIDYDEDDFIMLVKFDNFDGGHSGGDYYSRKGIKGAFKNQQHLWVREEDLYLLEGEEHDKPTQKTLSKAKLDKVIELKKKYFLTPFNSVELDNAMESLREAEKDCGEEIGYTGLVDIVSTIISSTKEHNTPNETIYKVYEALGYMVE